MARSQGDIVWKFAGDTWERKYTTWVGALQSLIYNIKAQRVQKREDKRADRLKEREQNTPPLPKGLEDWAKKTGIGTEHFLYYKRHGRYADIACSACGQVTEAAVRSKDTYEGQFEKIIPVPQHDSVGTCPHCGAIPCGKPGTAERSERNIEIYHSSKVHAQDRAVFRMRDPGYYAGTHVWKDGKCCKRRNPHLCGLSAYADTEGV